MTHPKPLNGQTKAPAPRTRADDAQEIKQLETILQRIQKRTPFEPYIVSTPSDVPYHVSHNQRDDFRRGTAFGRGEAQLDYMSFLYRDTSNNVLCLEAQDSHADRAKLSAPSSARASRPTTPALGPRKKISLADYKNRADQKHLNASHTSSVAASPAAGSQTQLPGSSLPKADGDAKVLQAAPVAKPSEPDGVGAKNPPEAVPVGTATKPSPKSSNVSSSNHVKNGTNKETKTSPIRTSTTATIEETGSANIKHEGENSMSSHKASDVKETQSSGQKVPHKQNRVPAVVTTGKDRREEDPKPLDTKTASSLSVKDAPSDTVTTPQTQPVPEADIKDDEDSKSRGQKSDNPGKDPLPTAKAPDPEEAPLSEVPAVRVVPTEDQPLTNDYDGEASDDDSIQAPAWSPLTSVGSLSPTSLQMSAATSRSSATSAELAISLPTDAAIENAKKHMTRQSTSGTNQQSQKELVDGIKGTSKSQKVITNGKAPTSGVNTNTKAQKRSRDVEEAESKPDTKRRKTLEAGDKEVQPNSDTKVAQDSSAKSGLARTSSNGLLTPVRQRSGGTLDPSKGVASNNPPTPSLTTSEKRLTGTARKWRDETKRLHTLGKQLKAESLGNLEASKKIKKASEKSKLVKMSLAQGVESGLSFMLAFCAQGAEGELSNRGWRGASEFLDEVKDRAGEYPLMEGCCHLLLAACAGKSLSILGKIELADIEKQGGFEEHYAELQACIRRSEQAAVEAGKLFTKAALAKKYPATTKALEGLPLGAPTVIAVTRMGQVFLGEWSKQQGVGWKPQLDEGLCAQLQ